MSGVGFYIPGYIRDKHVGGYVHIEDPEGPDVEYTTLQCCHCNSHFKVPKGVGGIQEMCRMCMAPHCPDKEQCFICIPFEAKLEAAEGRRKLWKEIDLALVGLH